ncbi:MAG: tetratricopeptide repeat protein [Dysgonamonadaceae bacterium]|jgi:tetratricopeptide (TPR) repeat protein|nr:tetratricopeptide repeat protein [Dysgonamonadaceae bacterium]
MKHILSITGFVVVFLTGLSAQTLEEAKKLYLEAKYPESMPAFEKAVKTSPQNASYNQWYGNCLLETGQLEESEKYLKFAASKNIQEAFTSLGKLYFQTYRFDEAVESYEGLITLLKKKKDEIHDEETQRKLDLAKRAARMLSRCENVQIIDSLVVDKNSFLSGYPLSEEAGSLRMMSEMGGAVVYQNQLKDRRYYGKQTTDNRIRLYSQSELQGKWSDEKRMELPLDTSANDNYPYILSDGVTVYFASTGRESIGGYDLYTTRYNMNSDNYLAPEQMGMPFNSIYNDYMLVLDEFNGVGYFATDRFQEPGKVIIYTYIPNDEIKTIDSEDRDMLSGRARILSIKDTWKPGMNYQAMLAQIKEAASRVTITKKKDFMFVINDNIIYYTLTDFENESARQLFVQSQTLGQQIAGLETELDSQRLAYSKGNKSVASSVKTNETKLEKMYADYRLQVIKARNTEIQYLRQNQK